MKTESKIKENREKLKSLSTGVKILLKEGVYDSVNEGLTDLYKKEGHKELKKFWEWKREGKTIKKGEHALLLWGQLRKATKKETQEAAAETEKNEFDYWPICYVFSNLQVI